MEGADGGGEMTKEERVSDAKEELRRKISQMVSSGRHDLPAIKEAIELILDKWN